MTDFVPDTPNTRLRNEDFRRLLTSARSERAPSTSTTSLEHHNKLAPESSFKQPKAPGGGGGGGQKKQWKKPYHPKPVVKEKVEKDQVDELIDESEAQLKEILLKYRDRAAERRKGDKQEDLDEADIRMKLAGGFKVSVAFLGQEMNCCQAHVHMRFYAV